MLSLQAAVAVVQEQTQVQEFQRMVEGQAQSFKVGFQPLLLAQSAQAEQVAQAMQMELQVAQQFAMV
jgi:hypothetical protein